jgi:hypothetical protein
VARGDRLPQLFDRVIGIRALDEPGRRPRFFAIAHSFGSL